MTADNEPTLSGKTVLITGAARRVGAQLARSLHAAGMNLVLHYRHSRTEAEALGRELDEQRPGSVALASADLLHSTALSGLARRAHAAFGRLDAVINNASTFYPTKVGEITDKHWDELMGSNLKAPLFLSQACAPFLEETEGAIVNIVDIHADRPLKDYTVYCIAKAGLAMLTRSLARELAPKVRVNGIAPGAIMWPEVEAYAAIHQEIIERTALKREGTPEDIAKAVRFLLRDAPYVTGQIITVDGGRTLSN